MIKRDELLLALLSRLVGGAQFSPTADALAALRAHLETEGTGERALAPGLCHPKCGDLDFTWTNRPIMYFFHPGQKDGPHYCSIVCRDLGRPANPAPHPEPLSVPDAPPVLHRLPAPGWVETPEAVTDSIEELEQALATSARMSAKWKALARRQQEKLGWGAFVERNYYELWHQKSNELAALKASIAERTRTVDYYKAEHAAANAEIDRLKANLADRESRLDIINAMNKTQPIPDQGAETVEGLRANWAEMARRNLLLVAERDAATEEVEGLRAELAWERDVNRQLIAERVAAISTSVAAVVEAERNTAVQAERARCLAWAELATGACWNDQAGLNPHLIHIASGTPSPVSQSETDGTVKMTATEAIDELATQKRLHPTLRPGYIGAAQPAPERPTCEGLRAELEAAKAAQHRAERLAERVRRWLVDAKAERDAMLDKVVALGDAKDAAVQAERAAVVAYLQAVHSFSVAEDIKVGRHLHSGIAAPNSESIARRFHETYERLAPSFGYKTRRESAVPWADVPEASRALMIATCAEVFPLPAPVSQPARRYDWLPAPEGTICTTEVGVGDGLMCLRPAVVSQGEAGACEEHARPLLKAPTVSKPETDGTVTVIPCRHCDVMHCPGTCIANRPPPAQPAPERPTCADWCGRPKNERTWPYGQPLTHLRDGVVLSMCSNSCQAFGYPANPVPAAPRKDAT